MCSLRLAIFLTELNGMELHQADAGNACLEAKAEEKVCFAANEAFGKLTGHMLAIHEALCGLRSSRKRWPECFAGMLHCVGFKLPKVGSGACSMCGLRLG